MGLFRAERKAGNYPYACARVKSRKAFLLTRDNYPRLLVMDLPEISRFIGEGQYRKEVDDLSGRFSGVDLIEAATYLNLARTYHDLLKFTLGELREMVGSYINRWDLWNLKTVIRGKTYGAPWEEVSDDLIAAGAFDKSFFSTLFTCAGLQEMAELFQKATHEPDSGFLKLLRAGGQPSLADIENILDKEYYSTLLKSVPETVPANKLFLKFLKAEIDVVNLKTLFKLKFENTPSEKIPEYLVQGGDELTSRVLGRLAATENFAAFLSELEGLKVYEAVREAAAAAKEAGSLNRVIRDLDRHLMARAKEFSHLFPLSVLPIIDYLLRKKIEVDNLRIIARGKQSGLPEDVIRDLLLM